MSFYATMNTKGERKDARREIRNVLGTSRDSAPSAMAAVRAAFYLDKMLNWATGGQLRLGVFRAGQTAALTPAQAIEYVRVEGWAE